MLFPPATPHPPTPLHIIFFFFDLLPLLKQGGEKNIKVNETVLLKYIYIWIKFLMYKILF